MNTEDSKLPPSAVAPPPEDAGSQALAEAMRSSFVIVQIIMVLLVLLFLGSGFFTVGPSEQAIILRLGKPVDNGRLFLPGPHWAWPRPIDEVVKLRITSLTSADSSVGWYQSAAEWANGAPKPPGSPKLNPALTTYALSADTNIIHVRATAQYRITNPTVFHFGFTDSATFITNALNNALLQTCVAFPVDGILTSNRAEFREHVEQRARELIESENLGVTLAQVEVTAWPPIFLETKFKEVDLATFERDSMLKRAESYATTNVASAQGDAATRVNVADAARKRKVDMMAAQANAFSNLLAQYEHNPELFKRIKQMSVLNTVYTNADQKIMVPPNSKELRFNFSREPEAPVNNIPTQP